MTIHLQLHALVCWAVFGLALLTSEGMKTVVAAEGIAEVDSETIAKLIDQLGSAFFEEREAAARELRILGNQVVPQLQQARDHKSAEVRSRVAALLRQQSMPLREAIQAFAKKRDEDLDLEEGMWLIARIVNPDVQRVTITRQLNDLAAAVRKRTGEAEPKSVAPDHMVAILQEVLFEQEKFGGNFDDYQNPDNSSIEKVLHTKRGLPILVSHVVIAVGRRLDLPIVGVPTAGRYIVKYDGQRAAPGLPTEDIFLDPFNNGKVLTRADRAELFPEHDPDRLVAPQTTRRDLMRMLTNLESHLFGRDETTKAFQAVEFRVALERPLQQPE